MICFTTPLRRTDERNLLVVLLTAWFLFYSSPGLANQFEHDSLDWLPMIQGLSFGLVIFLFGMVLMGEALKSALGYKMKRLLQKLTTNRIKGLLMGLGVTAITQSSSVTTVMLVSFVSVGLMSFARTVPAILGADVGTTITAQIIAFKITHLAPPLTMVGFALFFNRKLRAVGETIFGLGLIIYGMDLMSEAMKPLRSHEPFMQMMVQMEGPLIGILIGAGFTALIQSSAATIGVVIALSVQGLVSLEAGIALALGANIGTCVTAGLAAIGKSREAVRVAMAHILIKVAGVLIILPLLPVFTEFVIMVSPQATAGRSAASALQEAGPRQIANAHTLFNVGIALLFLPLTVWIARFVERLIPQRQAQESETIIQPLSLPESLITTSPGMAIEAVRREIYRIGKLVEEGMQKNIGEAMISGNERKLNDIAECDHDVNRLYRNLVSIIPRISQEKLSPAESKQIGLLWELADLVEIMGDSIKELAQSSRHRIFKTYALNDETKSRLIEFDKSVTLILGKALATIAQLGVNQERSLEMAREVLSMKKQINLLADAFKRYLQKKHLHEERTNEGHLGYEQIHLYAVETDLVARMRSSANLARKIAKAVLDTLSDVHPQRTSWQVRSADES